MKDKIIFNIGYLFHKRPITYILIVIITIFMISYKGEAIYFKNYHKVDLSVKKIQVVPIIPSKLDLAVKKLYGNINGNIVIEQCNKYAKNPKHCKIVHSFVSKAESDNCKNSYKFNCYGNIKYKFKSYKESIIQFNNTYNKYYYKNLIPSDFYRNKGYGKTHYCTSEYSSKSSKGCPNGLKNANNIYNLLINLK